MLAIEVRNFGGPDVLEVVERPEPVVGDGQLVVAAAACDVLWVDTMIRSGRAQNYFPIRPPYVPGNGVGGVVEAIGPGVQPTWLGRQVVAHTAGAGGGDGYAQRALVDLGMAAPVPAGVSLLDATAVLHDGTTALAVLEVTGAGAGDWVIVLGAGGGMGILLVQLLSARGARVIGAAKGRSKLAVVAGSGAELAVDYSEPGWTEVVADAIGGRRIDVALDGVGGALGGAAFDLVADGGRFSAHGTPSGTFAAFDQRQADDRGIKVTTIADLQFAAGPRARFLTRILDELAAGTILPLVGQTYPLAEAAEAHRAIEERRAIGKTLLDPTEPLGAGG